MRTIRISGYRVAPSDPPLTVYIAHRDELLSYANKFLRDRSIAEDVVQEAWLRLSARDGQGEEITQTVRYLYSIVRNLALDWIRRGPREVTEGPDSSTWRLLPADEPTAEDVVVQRDEVRALMEAIAELPERTQLAFRMHKLEGKSLQEVADFMGVSLARTHQIVREALLHATQRLFGDSDS